MKLNPRLPHSVEGSARRETIEASVIEDAKEVRKNSEWLFKGEKISYRQLAEMKGKPKFKVKNCEELKIIEEKEDPTTEHTTLVSVRAMKIEPKEQEQRAEAIFKKKHLSLLKKKVESLQSAVLNFSNLKYTEESDMKNRILVYFKDYSDKINFSNNINVEPPASGKWHFKVYIEPGNNHKLIETTFRRRWWWQITNDKQFKEFNNINWTCFMNESCAKIVHPGKPCYFTTVDPPIPFEQFKSLIANEIAGNGAYSQAKYDRNMMLLELNRENYDLWRSVLDSDSLLYIFKFYILRNKLFNLAQHFPMQNFTSVNPLKIRSHNHFVGGYQIGDKMYLYENLVKQLGLVKNLVREIMPVTFILDSPNDKNCTKLIEYMQSAENSTTNNIWILKPAYDSNRGQGIKVVKTYHEIMDTLARSEKSLIVQKYIERPLLYKNRKFDIRMYVLVTWAQGSLKAYWYKEGYARTSCVPFSLSDVHNRFIHLTNEAIQIEFDRFGELEQENKLTFQQLQKFIDERMQETMESLGSSPNQHQPTFKSHVLPKMKVW